MNKLSPTEAIYAKCLDCCCDDIGEVKKCPITECPLYPWHSKCKKHISLSDEEKQRRSERAKLMLSKRGF